MGQGAWLRRRARCRVRRLRTYNDAGDAVAAIFVASPLEQVSSAVAGFELRLWSALLLVCALGVWMALVLARGAVRPLLAMLEERERYLPAAAHELRPWRACGWRRRGSGAAHPTKRPPKKATKVSPGGLRSEGEGA